MAGANKENKEKKAARSESAVGDSGALLQQLVSEIAALRADVEVLKSASSAPLAEANMPTPIKRKSKKNTIDAEGSAVEVADATLWQSADDAEVARIGYAFSSAPKVALIRALLQEGPLSAAKLGEITSLTTGSLYHHLRELTHADVLASEGRSRFALTERGHRLALLLFTQAGHP